MLQKKENVIYLSVNKGSFWRYMGKDRQMESYNRVAGFVEKLSTEIRPIEDQNVKFLLLRMVDGDEIYNIQVPMYTSAGPDIIRHLAYAAEKKYDIVSGSMVAIEVYLREKEDRKYTNAALYWGETKLEWDALPNGMTREAGLDVLYDKIVKFLELLKSPGVNVGAPDDMPGDIPPGVYPGEDGTPENPFDGLR